MIWGAELSDLLTTSAYIPRAGCVQKHRKCELRACLIGRVPRHSSPAGMQNPKFGLSCVHCVIQISQLLLSCVHCVIQNAHFELKFKIRTLPSCENSLISCSYFRTENISVRKSIVSFILNRRAAPNKNPCKLSGGGGGGGGGGSLPHTHKCRNEQKFDMTFRHAYSQLRARRALSLYNDVPLRTRRALSLHKVYGNSALLVLNGISLNRVTVNALLVLNGTSLNSVTVNALLVFNGTSLNSVTVNALLVLNGTSLNRVTVNALLVLNGTSLNSVTVNALLVLSR